MTRGFRPGRSSFRRAALLLLFAFAPPSAAELPDVGASLPNFEGKNLHGEQVTSTALRGRPALVVVVSERSAAPQVQSWFEAAAGKVSGSVNRLAVVSLDMPFYVPYSAVQSRARGKVPKQYWSDVLLDDTGEMASALGVPEKPLPYVLVVSPEGKVLANASGGPDDAEAKRVWEALSGAG